MILLSYTIHLFSNFAQTFNSQSNDWVKGKTSVRRRKINCCQIRLLCNGSETQKSWKPLLNTIFALSGSLEWFAQRKWNKIICTFCWFFPDLYVLACAQCNERKAVALAHWAVLLWHYNFYNWLELCFFIIRLSWQLGEDDGTEHQNASCYFSDT